MQENDFGDSQKALPLCVDLDGTIVNTDTLVECLLVGTCKWSTLKRIPGWIVQGKAKFKEKLAQHIQLNPALLPYNDTLVQYLKREKSHGRRLVLVTAANQSLAQAISDHLGIFDEVIASDGSRNLRGEEKAKLLVERFGNRGFSYAGNDRTDLKVWECAYSGVLVNTHYGTAKRAAALTTIEQCINCNPNQVRALWRAIRPHQWVKNLLVFVPIITARAFVDFEALINGFLLFIAFCVTASGIYLINDLFDLEADRQHPTKCKRPFASGALAITTGFAMAAILIVVGFILSAATQIPIVALLLLVYGVASISYSLKLKEFPLVDVFMLAALYSIRLFSGGEATGHHVSFWLLAFSGFLFLSLAIIKRTAELKASLNQQKHHIVRRGYSSADLLVIQTFGIGASFISSLVLALYIQSYTAVNSYTHPQILWFTVPVMLFWECRLWLSTTRGYMNEDPIVYTAKDWVSWMVGIVLILILLAANIKG